MKVVIVLKNSHIDELLANLIYTNLEKKLEGLNIHLAYSSNSNLSCIFHNYGRYQSIITFSPSLSFWKNFKSTHYELAISLDNSFLSKVLLKLCNSNLKINLKSTQDNSVSDRSKVFLKKKINQLEKALKHIHPDHKIITTPSLDLNDEVLSNTLNFLSWNNANNIDQNAVILIDKSYSDFSFKELSYFLINIQKKIGFKFTLILEHYNKKQRIKLKQLIDEFHLTHINTQYLLTSDHNQISAIIFNSKFLISNSIQWIYLSSLLNKKIPSIDIHLKTPYWKKSLTTDAKKKYRIDRKIEEIVYFVENL